MAVLSEQVDKHTVAGATVSLKRVVSAIRWVGATTAGHACVIVSPSDDSDILWESVAGGSNNVEESNVQRLWPNGYKVLTLASGTLYLEYGFRDFVK